MQDKEIYQLITCSSIDLIQFGWSPDIDCLTGPMMSIP